VQLGDTSVSPAISRREHLGESGIRVIREGGKRTGCRHYRRFTARTRNLPHGQGVVQPIPNHAVAETVGCTSCFAGVIADLWY
jgi:hypothetical protein